MKSQELKGKIAVIFGAAGGIGASIARLLDDLDLKLILSDINIKKLQVLKKELRNDSIIEICNITDISKIQSLYSKIFHRFDRIDIMINTVGIIIPSLFENSTHADIQKQVDINLMGAINCIKEVIPYMKRAGEGNIITISSLAGIVPETHSSIYTATKFALRGLNLTINLELKKHDIVVSTIFPDSVDTSMLEFEARYGGSPLTFLDDPVPPEDVAKAVLKSILKNKVEICVPKSQGRLSKFIMCFPKLVQRLWPKFEKKGEIKKREFLSRLT